MGSNERGHPDEPGVPDHPSSGGGERDAHRARDAHTDRAASRRPSHGQRAAEGAPAETLNREECSDRTRGQGPPIPTDRPGHDGRRAGEDDLRTGQRERSADTASSVKMAAHGRRAEGAFDLVLPSLLQAVNVARLPPRQHRTRPHTLL